MLKFLAGRKRSRNAILIFFIAVLTLSLIGLFSVVVGGGVSGLFGGVGNETAVAKVGSYKVTVKEMRDALTLFGQRMAMGQGRANRTSLPNTFNDFWPQVLDDLIRKKVILYEAERLNIGASDEAVQAKIKQFFSPWPGADQYRLMIQQQYRMTPIEYEENLLRPAIAEEHLTSFITAAVQVSPEEVKEEYRRNNTNYSVLWVEVDPARLSDKVQINEADLLAYFDQRKGEFRIESEQRRARYVFVDQKKAEQAVQIPDEELKKTFDADPDRYVQQVRVSQIVLNIPKDGSQKEEDIRKKAQELVQRARGAEGKPVEDFAKLARETSEDAATKAKGGDIGWVNKKDHAEAGDPLVGVFNLKQGNVSEPTKKDDKFYIFKVVERKAPSFAEARQQILESTRSGKSYDKAVELIRDAETRLKETKDADAVAAEINRKAGAQVAAVKDTGFFSQGEEMPDLDTATDLQTAIFEFQNPGEVTSWVNVKDGFAVAHYLEKRDPHEPAFEEVRPKVEGRYREDKAKELAADLARQLAQAKTPEELSQRADGFVRQYVSGKKDSEGKAVKVDERGGIKLSDSIGPLVSEADRAPVYKLNKGEVTSEPLKAEDGDVYVVAAMKDRQEPDMVTEFEKQRKSIEENLLSTKRNSYFTAYLSMTMQKLKEDGTVKIYKDALDAAFAGAAQQQAEQPQPQVPGLPATPPRPRRPSQSPPPGTVPGKQ